MKWGVFVQHWNGWVEGWGRGEAKEGARSRKQPPISRQIFDTREAAERRLAKVKEDYPDRSTTLVWLVPVADPSDRYTQEETP